MVVRALYASAFGSALGFGSGRLGRWCADRLRVRQDVLARAGHVVDALPVVEDREDDLFLGADDLPAADTADPKQPAVS